MKKLISWGGILLWTARLYAADGLSLEIGVGDRTVISRVGVLWNWKHDWFTGAAWHGTGSWEATAGLWLGNSSTGSNQTVIDLGVAPVLRLDHTSWSHISPYLEASLGLHAISPTFIYDERKLGCSFQFAEFIGLGVRFGDGLRYDLGFRLQHLSNANIASPNQGLNIGEFRFCFHF